MKNKSIKEFFKPLKILLFFFIFGCSTPKLFVESSVYSFNDIEIGESIEKEIIIKNDGKGKLKINDITISGEGYNKQNQNNAIVIFPNQSYTLNINFSPVELGNSSGLLVINSNNPENKLLNIKLQGKGIPNGITPDPGSVYLGLFTYDDVEGTQQIQEVRTGRQSLTSFYLIQTNFHCFLISLRFLIHSPSQINCLKSCSFLKA